MKKFIREYKVLQVVLIVTAVISLFACKNETDYPDLKNSIGWKIKQLETGVVWRTKKFNNLFGHPQYINVIDINLNEKSIQPSFVYSDSILLTTHEMAENAKSIAAVNGNFFHTTAGGSVCFVKVNHKIISNSRTDLGDSLFLDQLDDAAITLDSSGSVRIIACPPGGWALLKSIPTIISSGPPLIIKGRNVKVVPHLFNDERFSRTGAGITKDNHLILITADGNLKESAGLTIPEFIRVFEAFKCENAINLDGGGSTTMWIKGEPANGIVNHPTDNKKFDHFGERKVANCLVIKSAK